MPDSNGNYHVPKWFVRFVSWGLAIMFMLASPWVAWATVTLIKLDTKADVITTLERDWAAHVKDPSIHHSGINALNGRLSAIEHRLGRIETKLDNTP